MAIFFAENKDDAGGLQKLQVDEKNLTEEEKEVFQSLKDDKTLMTAEEYLAGSKGTKPNDAKIEVQGGNALTSEIDKSTIDEQNDAGSGGGKKKDSGFKSFVESVGSAFQNIAEGAEKKLETVYDDREKRAMFLSGLNTIIDASSYTPITKAKSPFGTIAGGQKKGFLESEAIGTKRAEIEAKKLAAEAKKNQDANKALIDMLKINIDKDKAKTAQMKPLYDRLFNLLKERYDKKHPRPWHTIGLTKHNLVKNNIQIKRFYLDHIVTRRLHKYKAVNSVVTGEGWNIVVPKTDKIILESKNWI